MDTKLNNLISEKDQLTTSEMKLQENNLVYEQKLSELGQKVLEVENKFSDAEKKILEAGEKVSASEKKVWEANLEVEQLKTELISAVANISEKMKEIQEMSEKIEKLEKNYKKETENILENSGEDEIQKNSKNIQHNFAAREVAVVVASSLRGFHEKIQNLLNLEISNFEDIVSDSDKLPTTEFLKLVANNLGLTPESHMIYIEKWYKNLGGFFCGTVEQVHVLVKSTCWKKTELEEIPAQNNMVKAEIEKMLYRK